MQKKQLQNELAEQSKINGPTSLQVRRHNPNGVGRYTSMSRVGYVQGYVQGGMCVWMVCGNKINRRETPETWMLRLQKLGIQIDWQLLWQGDVRLGWYVKLLSHVPLMCEGLFKGQVERRSAHTVWESKKIGSHFCQPL